MSNNIDQKVVQMRFDNKQFESGIATSISSIAKLNQSLKLTDATKGLENVDAASKGVDMSVLASAVESVSTKFSALQVMAVTALANITNSAVNAGKQLVSSLTIDQITAGWTKYEQKTSSVQTIMNSTGKSIDEVNTYLDKLMWFSDETSYSFTDMTAALGQMTSAGGDINKLIPLITGVANATAYAGKGASEFSRVIYNLNQSYGAGYLQLMDWKSVELAGVGSKQLKETLIQTAEQLGKIKKGQVTVANFAESLKDKWADTEVMEIAFGKFGEFSDAVQKMVESGEVDTAAEAIEKLSGQYGELGEKAFKSAQEAKSFSEAIDATKDAVSSGWLNSAEIIFGNYEEAKVMWTELANTLWDVFASGAEARNEMLQGWKDLGGRTAMIDAVKNAFHGLSSVIEPLKEAFTDIFPPITSEQLYNFTEGLKNLTEKFKISDETADKLKRTFKGVFALIKVGIDVIGSIVGAIFDLVGCLAPAGDGLLSFTAYLGDGLVKFKEFVGSSDAFNKAISKITEVLSKVVKSVSSFVGKIAEAIKGMAQVDTSGIDSFVERVRKRFQPLTILFSGIVKIFEVAWKFIKKVAPIITSLIRKIGEAFRGLAENISKAIDNADYEIIFDIILGSGLITSIKKLIDFMSGVAKDNPITGFIASLTQIKDAVVDTLGAFQEKLKSEVLHKIASAVAILAAALVVLTFVDSAKLAVAMGAITTLFVELFASMAIFGKVAKGDGFDNLGKIAGSMIAVSAAILILSFAMTNLQRVDWEGLAKGLLGVVTLSATLGLTVKLLSTSNGKLLNGSMGLIVFAASMLILVEAVEKLSSLNIVDLCKGLLGVAALMATLGIFVNNTTGMEINNGLGLVLLATSMLILTASIEKLGSLSPETIVKGLLALAGALLVISNALDVLPDEGMLRKSASLVVLATALTILAAAFTIFANLSLEEVGLGLLGMAGALIIISKAINSLQEAKLLTKSAALVALSTALTILAAAFTIFAKLSLEEVGLGLLGMAGALLIIKTALDHLPCDFSSKAAALLLLGAALTVLAITLRLFGSMSLEEIGLGLAALVGVLGIFIGVCYALAPISSVLLIIAGAVALLGVACLAAGAGILAISVGLTGLSVAGAGVSVALTTIITSIASLIPYILEKVAEGIVALCGVITRGIPAICDMLIAVVLAVLKVINDCAPDIIECVIGLLTKLFNSLLQFLTDALPKLMDFLALALDEILAFIVESTPKIVEAGMQIIINFLDGISQKLPEVIAAGVRIITSFLLGLGKELPKIVDAAVQMVLDFINGIIDAADKFRQGFITAAKKIINMISESVEELSGLISRIGYDILKGIVKGMTNSLSYIWGDICSVGESIIGGFKKFFGIHSPSRLARDKIGRYITEGVGDGMVEYADSATDAATYIGEETINSLSNAIGNVADVINGDIDSSPTIRPVLDLSQVQNEAKQIDSMFGKQSVSLAGTNNELINNNIRAAHEQMQSSATNNNSDVVDALTLLRNEFGEIIDTIANLKIVMDSGAVVGELAGGMDAALGRIAIRRGRGN